MDRPQFERIKRKKRCRKDRFKNEFEAARRARQLGMRSYFCPACRGWHLTSQEYRG